MRVLLSPPFIGGAGGIERAVHDVTSVFAGFGHRVDIAAQRTLGGTWAIDPERFHAVPRWRIRGAGMHHRKSIDLPLRAARPLRRQLSPRYDLHLGFRWTQDINRVVRADCRWITPSGYPLTPDEMSTYDAAALEAPDNLRFVPPGVPAILLPPPLLPLADEAERPSGLPEQFILTVFNPYSPVKGLDELRSFLGTTPLPVVWCLSSGTLPVEVPPDLVDHPRLVVQRDMTRPQLRYLYEHAFAYVSFSRSEGFGWAIADGLRYSPRVVARRIGVLSFDEALQPGVTVFDGQQGVAGLDWGALEHDVAPIGGRNLDWLSAEAFHDRVMNLLNR
jgi:glycosyltransferase involved in cell wall biosynthesis